MVETKQKTKQFVLIKLGHQFTTIGNSVGGVYSKFHPSEEPGRLDVETFDYFDTLEKAQNEALARKGINPKDIARSGPKEKAIGTSATSNGITKGTSLFKNQRNKTPQKPSREEQREKAKVLNPDGSSYDPALDLNKDGVNNSEDNKIATKVLLTKYKEIQKHAKSLGIKSFGKTKKALLKAIAEKESEN